MRIFLFFTKKIMRAFNTYGSILLVVTFALFLSLYIIFAYSFPEKKEREFLLLMSESFLANGEKILVPSLKGILWDHVDIIVQVDDSWSESSVLDFIKSKNYNYKYFDVFYVPRIFQREYEAVFIFTKNKSVSDVVRLSVRELSLDKVVYRFDPIIKDSDDKNFWLVRSISNPSGVLSRRLGYEYEGVLKFLKPKEM